MREKTSIVACMKNEAPYLKEWIEFHKLVGFEHFYLYDNQCTDDTREVLKPYEESGLVTVNELPLPNCQLAAYYHALYSYRYECDWMAFIDIDEFLFSPKGEDIKVFLTDFKALPAVTPQWMTFGSNGHEQKPEGLVIENFTKRGPSEKDAFEPNKHIKSIVNPKVTVCPAGTPHNFFYMSPNPPVNEQGHQNTGPYREGEWTYDKIRINHYYCKSKEEYQEKINRGRADAPQAEQELSRTWEDFDKHDNNEVEDLTILQYLKPLKEQL
jgi:hypothetical protein